VPREIGFGRFGFRVTAGRRRMFEFFANLKSDKGGFTLIELFGGDRHHRHAVGDGAGGNDGIPGKGKRRAASERYSADKNRH